MSVRGLAFWACSFFVSFYVLHALEEMIPPPVCAPFLFRFSFFCFLSGSPVRKNFLFHLLVVAGTHHFVRVGCSCSACFARFERIVSFTCHR